MAERVVGQDFRFSSGAAQFAGVLSFCSGDRPLPALILITGSGAHDRDESVCGHKPFKVIADFFVRCGYAVLRFDDRGVGGSSGTASRATFDDRVADTAAAFRSLASAPVVDSARISLCGHSEGGLIAAAASPGLAVQSVIMLAGPAVSIETLIHDQARAMSQEAGASTVQIAHERLMNETVFAVARDPSEDHIAEGLARRIIERALRAWPELEADEASVVANAREMAAIVCAPDYRSLLRQDPASILSAVDRPILAVYGGKDCQVAGADNLAAFERATAANPHANALLFEDMNHLFQRAETGSISEYESLPPGPDEAVLEAVAEWLEVVTR